MNLHCPSIDGVGIAGSACDGYELIKNTEPDLVFLDIKMPEKSGFDLLRMFDEIKFNVVFVTAYDEYAIQAFEFNAIDYILKPIDYMKLIRAINKVESNIKLNTTNNVIHFIHSMDEKSDLLKNITVHKNDKVCIIDLNDICFIQAARNYCEIITDDNQRLLSTKTLSDYEQLLSKHENFLRINKSTIVNINYIKEYTKGTVCFIIIKNFDQEMEVSRRKKSDITQFLMEKQFLLLVQIEQFTH